MTHGTLVDGVATWHPAGWRTREALHQPPWPDPASVGRVADTLRSGLPLVTIPAIDALRHQLSLAALGRAVVLQGGDCAETFTEPTTDRIARITELFGRASAILADRTGLAVVPVARIAGQYAKPRSRPTEQIDGVSLPSFFGDLVNGSEPRPGDRRPDPARMLRGYRHATRTLELLERHRWSCDRLHRRWGAEPLWTSHEALVLDYEEALTRSDPASGNWYLRSTHLPWIGERTRAVDGAHVAFLTGVANPLGVKVGPAADPDEMVELCERLDPDRRPGRLVLIARMGAREVGRRLPPVVAAVARAGHPVVWLCDPMHGNTRDLDGRKTREVGEILAEIAGFVSVLRASGGWPGGLHLECTPDAVTECLGGSTPVSAGALRTNYVTACDPRLNASQTLDVVRFAANLFG